MADPKVLEADALTFATRAVQCDQQGLVDTAVFYYTVIIRKKVYMYMYSYAFDAGSFPSVTKRSKCVGTSRLSVRKGR